LQSAQNVAVYHLMEEDIAPCAETLLRNSAAYGDMFHVLHYC